jgi:hypothetical protein
MRTLLLYKNRAAARSPDVLTALFSRFGNLFCIEFVVTVQPCAGLHEKVCGKLACISTFSSKSAYGEPTMLLVFINMETRRCHGQTVTVYKIRTFYVLVFYNLSVT